MLHSDASSCLKQGSHIRIYNVERGWKVHKNIHAKSLRWTVTDTSLSPDQRHLVSFYFTDIKFATAKFCFRSGFSFSLFIRAIVQIIT